MLRLLRRQLDFSIADAAGWAFLAAALILAVVAAFALPGCKSSSLARAKVVETPSIGHAAAATARVDQSLAGIVDVAREGQKTVERPAVARATLTTIDALAQGGRVAVAEVSKQLGAADVEIAKLRTAQEQQLAQVQADADARAKKLRDERDAAMIRAVAAEASTGYRAEQGLRLAWRWIERICVGGILIAIALRVAAAIFSTTAAGPLLRLLSNGALHVGTFLVSLVFKNVFRLGHQFGEASAIRSFEAATIGGVGGVAVAR